MWEKKIICLQHLVSHEPAVNKKKVSRKNDRRFRQCQQNAKEERVENGRPELQLSLTKTQGLEGRKSGQKESRIEKSD